MSEWIDVNDRKPADKQRVLVCFIDDVHRAVWHESNSCCQVATFHDYHSPVFTLDCESVGGYLNINIDDLAIDYWMSLPEPPEPSE